ncbi:SDR family NAD(P)-dependent oxidoreductase, partial [Acinetobacter baumannii]
VTLISRSEEKLQKALTSLDTSKKQKHQYIVADYSNTKTLNNTFQEYFRSNPIIHILVNNTGGPAGGDMLHATSEQLEKAF